MDLNIQNKTNCENGMEKKQNKTKQDTNKNKKNTQKA